MLIIFLCQPSHKSVFVRNTVLLFVLGICTFEIDFLCHRDEMKPRFQRQGYPEDAINSEFKKVVSTWNFGKSSNKNKGVLFVLTYHP